MTCHTDGRPKRHTGGGCLVEGAIWLIGLVSLPFGFGIFILILALLYSLWRLTTRKKVCRLCGSDRLVPSDSPAAKKIKKK